MIRHLLALPVALLPLVIGVMLVVGYVESPHAVWAPWQGRCSAALLTNPDSVCYDPAPTFHFGWLGEKH